MASVSLKIINDKCYIEHTIDPATQGATDPDSQSGCVILCTTLPKHTELDNASKSLLKWNTTSVGRHPLDCASIEEMDGLIFAFGGCFIPVGEGSQFISAYDFEDKEWKKCTGTGSNLPKPLSRSASYSKVRQQ